MEKTFESLFTGKTFSKIDYVKHSTSCECKLEPEQEILIFYIKESSNALLLTKEYDCYASGYLEDVTGEWKDIINTPIIKASESSQVSDCPVEDKDNCFVELTPRWRFYSLTTINGYFTMRWYTDSGNCSYYSDEIDIIEASNVEENPFGDIHLYMKPNTYTNAKPYYIHHSCIINKK